MTAPQQWLKFAEDDIRSAEVLLPEGIFNIVCFHCQQAVEKSLKAFLRQYQDSVPYIHILEELCVRCAKLDASFAKFRLECKDLDAFYQPTRYPEAPTGSLPEGTPTKDKLKPRWKKRKIFLSL
jgi:HEPN domain-containing protein